MIPLLGGVRLPLVWGALAAGAGFQFSGTSVSGSSVTDMLRSSSALMGVHVPLWVGLEARPICLLGAGIRGTRGVALGDTVSSYNMLTGYVSLNWTMGCSGSDFGLQ
ncbi:MAG: hypothetical protein HY898_14270 [Deltaproteobacteria bacterium]|nr:hypothetical protein [Deltaproteobacteria bacterium]